MVSKCTRLSLHTSPSLTRRMGVSEISRELEAYEVNASPSTRIRWEALLRRIKGTQEGIESSMHRPLSTLLTSISLYLAPRDAEQVLIFVPNSENRMLASHGSADDKPDLLAFSASRNVADDVANERPYKATIPSTHLLVCAGECKVRTQAVLQSFRYMFSISRHNPSSSLVYGLFADRTRFQFLALGLDNETQWKEVPWTDDDSIDKLCSCVKRISDSATSHIPQSFPNILSRSVFKVEDYRMYLYSATIGSTTFTLLPIYYGRGSGRKPFVAIAVPSDGGPRYPSIVRVFKYSWHEPTRHRRELDLLKRLCGVPGVVQIDESLCNDSLGRDEWSGRLRSLIAMKTVGFPLCSCKSALEFLEAMYDLLEVLRYLTQEKQVLHRDISWRNVLVRPENPPDVKLDFPVQPSSEPIPHTYRFISDIFSEEKRTVRVALADFDLGSDLSNSSESELKDATGTPMFMAYDVLGPRQHRRYIGEEDVEGWQAAALEPTSEDSPRSKYSDKMEKAAWDAFYSRLSGIEYIRSKSASFFKHGAVHDAESVFYLCFLFFNRMQRLGSSNAPDIPQERQWGVAFEALASRSFDTRATNEELEKKIAIGIDSDFQSLLSLINDYLSVPWYNVKSTGRGEKYEFHLHDFMQRLLLKEITRLRAHGDPIEISDRPRRVRVKRATGSNFSSHPRGLASILNSKKPGELQTVVEVVEDDQHIGPITRQSKHRILFSEAHLTLLKYKERERLWTLADKFA